MQNSALFWLIIRTHILLLFLKYVFSELKISFCLLTGYKYVFRPGFDKERCDHFRYQPFTFKRKDHTDCVFQKSNWSEQGQITYIKGNTSTDIRCKCDPEDDYVFVSKPSAHFCIPSEEDCTCYRRNSSLPKGMYNLKIAEESAVGSFKNVKIRNWPGRGNRIQRWSTYTT